MLTTQHMACDDLLEFGSHADKGCSWGEDPQTVPGIAHSDALPMDPLLFPDALAVIDRHYNVLVPYRAGRPNLYAVRSRAHLVLRYADFAEARLVLRPLSMSFPVNLIEIGPDASPGDYITGRVCLTVNELRVSLGRCEQPAHQTSWETSALSKRVNLETKFRCTTPVGPLRCLAMIISDLALSDSDISSSRL